VAAALLAAVVVGSGLGFLYLRHLSAYFVRETALDSTRMEADMMESVNAYYSDVLSRIDTDAVTITHEYMLQRNAMPLPATFTIDAGQRISENQSGLQFRLYSQYPFRADGGPRDPLQLEALQQLTRLSREEGADGKVLEFHKFVTVDGRPILHYARGQLMKESCVKCHNHHPQSPKRDWTVNELAGVLLITRPLDRDVQRTDSGFRSAFVVMGLTVIMLVGWSVIAMRSRSRG
jgi:eukaryotic-like serine/threonine-protein kinase